MPTNVEGHPDQFRALLDQCDDVLFIQRLSPLSCEYVTPSVERVTGYAAREFYADPQLSRNIVHAEDVGRFDAGLGGDAAGGTEVVRWVRKDGASVWMEVRWLKIFEAGQPVAVHGVARDVSARKLADESHAALSRSERNIRTILRSLPEAIGVAVDGRFVLVNPAFAKLTGYSEEELLGLHPQLLIPADDREHANGRLAAALAGETLSPREGKLLRRDGHVVDAELHAVRIELDGKPAALLFTVDLSERKALQARIALSDRLISVGTLAAGVAHEINNPLSFVSMNVRFVMDELERIGGNNKEIAGLITALDEARTGTDRIRDVVRDLKTFSRADDETRHAVDVAAVVEASLSVAWNEIRHRAQLVKDYRPVSKVFANDGQLGQVFLNLLLNCAQAIRDGNAERNEIRVAIYSAGTKVAVSISDTGVGIPAEVLPRIFDPFFTTKPIGVGTGLGLSIVHGIIESIGGVIRVDSEVGRGTTVIVEVPVYVEKDAPAPPPVARPPRARILVVDDEESVGSSLQRLFKRTHDVHFVTSAKRALELVRAGDQFDVVLCDLMMPEESGIELQRELSELAPSLAARMIFMTGGAFTPEADRFFRQKARWCLEKPFDLSAAERLIGEALQTPMAS